MKNEYLFIKEIMSIYNLYLFIILFSYSIQMLAVKISDGILLIGKLPPLNL